MTIQIQGIVTPVASAIIIAIMIGASQLYSEVQANTYANIENTKYRVRVDTMHEILIRIDENVQRMMRER